MAAIKRQLPVSYSQIKVVVKYGWITLEGQADWIYQRQQAEEAVRNIKGIKGISNLIEVKPKVEPDEIKRKIQEALKRLAELAVRSTSMPTAVR